MTSLRKLNPLHTPKFLAEMISATGCYPDSTRYTGRSTVLALRYIAQAIENPHEPVQIRDHHDSRAAHDNLCHQVHSICEALRLQHMQVRPKQCTVTFERLEQQFTQATQMHPLYRDRSRM